MKGISGSPLPMVIYTICQKLSSNDYRKECFPAIFTNTFKRTPSYDTLIKIHFYSSDPTGGGGQKGGLHSTRGRRNAIFEKILYQKFSWLILTYIFICQTLSKWVIVRYVLHLLCRLSSPKRWSSSFPFFKGLRLIPQPAIRGLLRLLSIGHMILSDEDWICRNLQT